MSARIVVTVSGPCNSGKSTVAEVIERRLLDLGLDVTLVEEDNCPPSPKTAPKRLALLVSNKTAVEVRTLTTKRDLCVPE